MNMKSTVMVIGLLFAQTVFGQVPTPSQPSTPAPVPSSQEDVELDTILMQTTFLIEGPSAQRGLTSFGTAFIVALPIPNTTPPQGSVVLLTAGHVLNEIQGDFATIHLRRRINEATETWVQTPFPLRIRANGVPLWKSHPQADVAAMKIDIPVDPSIRPITPLMFIDDKQIMEIGIHPGDEVRCLGFPLGVASNDALFPILRSGKIASYPLTPTEQTKTFLFDFRVFKGNSGGPVFFVERNRPTIARLGQYTNYHIIMGLVTEEKLFTEATVGQYSQEIHETQLGLAVVVHASLIKQTIDMLSPP
jgi:S1-C subfamily serine protease